MIKWIKESGVLSLRGTTYKAGDEIPAELVNEKSLASWKSRGWVESSGAPIEKVIKVEAKPEEETKPKRGRPPKKKDPEGSDE